MMDDKVKKLIDKYLKNLVLLKELYKNSCGEITLKISALNLCNTPDALDIELLKDQISKVEYLSETESKLTLISLFTSYSHNIDEKFEDMELTAKELALFLPNSIYSVLSSIILMSLKGNYKETVKRFKESINELKNNHPVSNAFEYAPFILLSSIKENTVSDITSRVIQIYHSLHDAAFARGTNSLCTSLYLSSLNRDIDTSKIRKIYIGLKSLIPANQFNYISCAKLYTCFDSFEDYEGIERIFRSISDSNDYRWFSEQLDIEIAISIYIISRKCNPLSHLDLEISTGLSSTLLTSMISSTLLLNHQR